jgi:hypothetical protein
VMEICGLVLFGRYDLFRLVGMNFCRFELVSRVYEFVCPSCEFVKF